jgi:hypothetical protein
MGIIISKSTCEAASMVFLFSFLRKAEPIESQLTLRRPLALKNSMVSINHFKFFIDRIFRKSEAEQQKAPTVCNCNRRAAWDAGVNPRTPACSMDATQTCWAEYDFLFDSLKFTFGQLNWRPFRKKMSPKRMQLFVFLSENAIDLGAIP